MLNSRKAITLSVVVVVVLLGTVGLWSLARYRALRHAPAPLSGAAADYAKIAEAKLAAATGFERFGARRYADSIAAFERAESFEPLDASATVDLVLSYAHTGNFAKGLALINQALQRFPANAHFYAVRAFVELKSGNLQAAHADNVKAQSLDPTIFSK